MNDGFIPFTWETPNEAYTPLEQNNHVMELLSLMQENGRDTSGIVALLDHVKGMEDFVRQADETLVQMKQQLADMQEAQNHPVRAALQNAIRFLENSINEVREQLADLKLAIVVGCQSAVEAVREKGITALDNLASFFRLDGAMEAISKAMGRVNDNCGHTLWRIESFGLELNNAGQALQNAGRALAGKEVFYEEQRSGMLAAVMKAPYSAMAAIAGSVLKAVDGMRESLGRMSDRAEAVREAKPRSLAEQLAAAKEKARSEPVADVARKRDLAHGLEM